MNKNSFLSFLNKSGWDDGCPCSSVNNTNCCDSCENRDVNVQIQGKKVGKKEKFPNQLI